MPLSYKERAVQSVHPLSKRLLNLMEDKQTNLCASVDLVRKQPLLELVDAIGPEVCIIKTHVDIVEDFDEDLIIQLQRLAEKHNFLLFEDRKFADIGNTVKHQYAHGIYTIADWADIVNAHVVTGPGTIEGLKEIGKPKGRGLLLYVQMTPKGNLVTEKFTQTGVQWAQEHDDFVMGFISLEKLSDHPGLIHMTPGVKLEGGGDALGQQYNTPQSVIGDRGSDVIIVGRGIYQADDPAAAAKKYRQAGWDAYLGRME